MDVKLSLDVTNYSANVNVWQDLGDLVVSGRVNGQHVQSSPLTVPVWLYTGDLSLIYLPVVLQKL
jgi:hypothetical protein